MDSVSSRARLRVTSDRTAWDKPVQRACSVTDVLPRSRTAEESAPKLAPVTGWPSSRLRRHGRSRLSSLARRVSARETISVSASPPGQWCGRCTSTSAIEDMQRRSDFTSAQHEPSAQACSATYRLARDSHKSRESGKNSRRTMGIAQLRPGQ
jgi:hypothetical protein